MLRCAITDRHYLGGDAGRWAADGVHFVQLRDKTLEVGELSDLARSILRDIAERPGAHTKLLINGRADVAVATGAHGVHLTAGENELTPEQVRRIFAHAGCERAFVSISCHTTDEVRRAMQNGADFILFGPVYEKRIVGEVVCEGVGLDRLREACRVANAVPVLALGGITTGNAPACVGAGAAGVAGIRMFA